MEKLNEQEQQKLLDEIQNAEQATFSDVEEVGKNNVKTLLLFMGMLIQDRNCTVYFAKKDGQVIPWIKTYDPNTGEIIIQVFKPLSNIIV